MDLLFFLLTFGVLLRSIVLSLLSSDCPQDFESFSDCFISIAKSNGVFAQHLLGSCKTKGDGQVKARAKLSRSTSASLTIVILTGSRGSIIS